MSLSAQVTELRSAFDGLQSEVGAAAERVASKVASLEAKIIELGEVDPDLQADIDEIKAATDELKAIAAEPAPEPGEGEGEDGEVIEPTP